MFFLRKLSKSYVSDLIFVLVEIVSAVAMTLLLAKITSRYGGHWLLNLDVLFYVSPLRRVFYVLIGMTFAMTYCRLQINGVNLSARLASLGEFAMAGIALVYQFCRNAIDASDGQKYVVDLILCGAFVFVFSFDSGQLSKALSNRTMQKLGSMAMYIYLIHYPIRMHIGCIVESRWGWNITSAFFFIIFEFAATYVLANFMYTKRISGKLAS